MNVMRKIGFHLREPDRGRRRFTSREWWWSLTIPCFWRLSCSPGCCYGEEYEFEGVIYRKSHRESGSGCRRRPRYLGHVAKGWWHLNTIRDSLWRWETQLVFAVGGEDNMAQVSLNLPLVGRFAVGVKVPRAWTKPWVYNRRQLGFELRGIWPTVYLGWDEQAHEMHDYYLGPPQHHSTCLRCGGLKWAHEEPDKTKMWADVTKDCPGFEHGLPPYVSRLGLRAGWKLSFRPNPYRLKNRLLGKAEITRTVLKVYDPVTVTLPEGDYPGRVEFFRETARRPRSLRSIRDGVFGAFETELWMPFPGKGENSYDCGDDGIQGHTSRIGPGRLSEIGGEDVAKVVTETIGHVLRYRARHGSVSWQPDGVGVMR